MYIYPPFIFQLKRARECTRSVTEAQIGGRTNNGLSSASLPENSQWTFDMTQCLIKAIRLFPPGTAQRLAGL
ncbi:unnamed protein product [Protopolystoma xenopodis]|uniref:Uncharacterized protein n=1 Tax=Protopolystoma xenopodis TaxID=117903 RepID=A0A3S5A850_9PLAT|nr:unnamed protein product [Protopolystoma xenopodis]